MWNSSLNKAFFKIFSWTIKQLIHALANNFYAILYKERKLILTWHSAQYQSKLSTSAHWSSVRSAQTGSYHQSHKSHAIQLSPSKYTFLHCGHIIWSDWSVLSLDSTADFLHFFLETAFCVDLDFSFLGAIFPSLMSDWCLVTPRPPPCLFLWVLRLLFPPY